VSFGNSELVIVETVMKIFSLEILYIHVCQCWVPSNVIICHYFKNLCKNHFLMYMTFHSMLSFPMFPSGCSATVTGFYSTEATYVLYYSIALTTV